MHFRCFNDTLTTGANDGALTFEDFKIMDVTRLESADDVSTFLKEASADSVALVLTGLMPLVEDISFIVCRRVTSRPSASSDGFTLVKALGEPRGAAPLDVMAAVIEYIEGAGPNISKARIVENFKGTRKSAIEKALDNAVYMDRLTMQRVSGAKGGNAAACYTAKYP